MLFALTDGREARLEFPPGMTAEDVRRLERRLRFELDEGSLWEFVALERPAAEQSLPVVEGKPQEPEQPSEDANVFRFDRPGNHAS